jgi:hypothetical protein
MESQRNHSDLGLKARSDRRRNLSFLGFCTVVSGAAAVLPRQINPLCRHSWTAWHEAKISSAEQATG